MLRVKNLPTKAGDRRDLGLILGLGRSPGEGNCNTLQYAWWRIPWTEELGRLQTMGSQRVGHAAAAAAAKSLQSCLTLCDSIDSSPTGSPIPGILQARTLEWVAIYFSNAWKWKAKVKLLSRVRLLETPWTAAHPAPPSMGFSRQEDWSGVPLPNSVIYPVFLASLCCIITPFPNYKRSRGYYSNDHASS